MASWTNNNSSYYINPAHLTFVENSGYGANLIQVSTSSSCYISVFIPGVIGYSDADKNYRRWKVTAYNNKFPDNSRFYIYVRLEKDGTSALIVYDKVLRGVHGGEIIEKTDDKGNVTKEEGVYDEKHAYYYIHIGEASGTDGSSIREIAYDTGYLTSDMSQNDKGGLNDMWELDKYSTPWMIRAKQWLHSFTLKGFITLIGGLVFRNSKGEDKRIVDVMRTVDSGDPNEGNYVPVDDTTIPTTAWVKSQSDDKYLKKYEPDETNYRIKFFDGIEAGHYVKGMVGGSGTIFDGQGYGEMNGLTLREFLEVPELRFNRIDVVSGELWNSIAFGLIEHVDTASRLAWVKLEEKERCGLHVYDICRGIFADFGDGTQWEGVDECGFLHLYGFWTSYFTPTEIVDSGEGSFCFRYELKPGTTQHPAASMKFAVYGNFLDTSRQASAYSTRTYKRYLSKVDTWVIDPDKHIYAQYGDLNGLTIGGKEMHGYGSFQSNSYFTGVQIQFTPQQKLELQGESAYSVTLSDYEGIVTIDDEGRIIGGETELLNVTADGKNVTADGKNVVTSGYRLKTQVQAMCGSKALFYSPSVPSEGSYIISVKPVGCTAMVLNGVVVVTSVFHTERCYVDVGVNCEGKASFSQTYHITAVKDGKNPIVADIDNEMDSVACDSAGKVLFGLPVVCTVSMWAGTRNLALDSLSVKAPAGVTCSADNTTGTVRVTDITQDAERTLPIGITAYASYGGTQYRKELVFTVNKVNAGENALLYKLSPSASSIKVDDAGNMTADGVTCEVVSSDGSTIETLAALPADGSLSMEYHLDKDAPKDYMYKSEVKVGTSTRTVTFKLYSKGNLIDVETIPVIADGGSPFVADLDNEMQSVACDEKGAVVLGLPLSTGVKAYYGSKELEVESITLGAVPGVTASVSGTTVSVTRIEQGAAENIRVPITVKARYDKDYTRTVYLIVNKLKQGNSAVVVDLVPSASSIKVDSEGLYTPSSISCKHKVTTGKDGSSIPSYIQENYSMKVAVDGDTTPDDYTYGTSLSAVSARTSVTFYLYYKGVLVDQETVPVVKDGEKGQDGTDGSDGKDGADAEFYMIEAAVGSIGYTMTGGYSPSSFIVSEYYVKGATKMSSNRNYIHIKGFKSGIATYLTYTSRVQEYLFNAGSWASYGFDSFLFELREGSGADSRLIGSTSVSVGKQGKDGTAGVMPRYCGSYDSDVTYIYDDQYRDIVVYRGNVFQVAAQGLSNKNVAPPVTDTSNSYWELANKFSFVAMDTALIDSANIAGFAFSVEGQTDNGTPVGLLRSQAEDTSVSCSYNGVWSQDGYYRKSPLSSVNGYSIEKVTLVANDNCRVLFNLQAFTSGTSNRGILGRLDVSYGPGQESNYLTDNTVSFSGNTSQEVSVFVPKGTHTIDVVFYKSQASAYPSDYVRYMIKASPKTASENCLVVHSNNGAWSTDGVYRKSPLSSVNGYSVEKIMLSASEDCHVLFNLAAFTSGSFNRGVLGKLDVSYGAGSEVMYLNNNTAEFSDRTVRTVPVFVPKGEHTIDVVFYTSLASYYPSDYVKYRITGSPRLLFSAQSGLLACADAYLSGSVNATAGNIGGFKIGENYLVNTDGKAYIHMESMDERHNVSMGGMYTHAGAEFSSVGGSASYFYASGSGACCLEVVADGSAKAVLSEGHVAMFTRYNSGQMVKISGLALSTQQAASFSKVYTDDDSPAGAWVDFLVMTGNVSLPAPSSSNNGKVVFVRCNPSYTLTVPKGVNADGGSGTSFKDGKTRFFICDGIQWHEFYCGG